ncbi:hypothetical protein [Catenulispora subtropica]|uniref:Uncharacterized protein n=1 Tax=Catenulispora subtropica TaxID=450798 RepID=A0ABP5DRU6_9ACTN
MADRISADPAAIDAFADRLTTLRAGFNDDTSCRNLPAGWLAPSAGNALADFELKWSFGEASIDSYFNALITMCRTSADRLRTVDADLAEQARGAHHSFGGRPEL